MWDLRYADDHSRVDFWLNSVASRASNAPGTMSSPGQAFIPFAQNVSLLMCAAVILVGTHLDDPMFSDLSIVEKRLEELNENFGRRYADA